MKTAKLRVTGLCEGNSPVTGEFPAQRAGNAENVPIWWRHHDYLITRGQNCGTIIDDNQRQLIRVQIFHWNMLFRLWMLRSNHWCCWTERATSHYLIQWWSVSAMHICYIRGRWASGILCVRKKWLKFCRFCRIILKRAVYGNSFGCM